MKMILKVSCVSQLANYCLMESCLSSICSYVFQDTDWKMTVIRECSRHSDSLQKLKTLVNLTKVATKLKLQFY